VHSKCEFTEISALPGYHLLRLPTPLVSQDESSAQTQREKLPSKPTPFMRLSDGSWIRGSLDILAFCRIPGPELTDEDVADIQELGVHVRVLAYNTLLVEGSTALSDVAKQMSWVQSLVWLMAGNTITAKLKKGLKINDENAAKAGMRIASLRGQFEKKLGIENKTEGAWDLSVTPLSLAVAALYAPLVQPVGYAKGCYKNLVFPELETLPIPYQEAVRKYRGTKLGKWTMAMYERHR